MGIDEEVEQQVIEEFPPATATLSCFYYVGSGERCGAPSPPGSIYCATHLTRMYRVPVDKLQNKAAEALIKCTAFTESGLLAISCRDIDAWGDLCNSLAGLVLHGYQRETECMEILLSSLLSNSSFRQAVASKLPPEWKTFEILVARLHIQQLSPLIEAVAQGKPLGQFAFRVYWNLRKRGRRTGRDRQIDVGIIATLGLQNIFVALECKDAELKIGDVEAFNTKLDDVGANKGVIATSAGFQEGAKRAAEAYNIDILLIAQEIPIMTTVTRVVSYFRAQMVGVFFEPDGNVEARSMPTELREMTICYRDGKQVSAAEVVNQILWSAEPVPGGWPPSLEHTVPNGTTLLMAGEQLPIAKIVVFVKFQPVTQQVTLRIPDRPVAFSLRDVLSGSEMKVNASEVPVAVPRLVEAGRFFINLMCQCYYCEKADNDSIALFLLDDKQHGTVISARLTAATKQSVFYFPVEDARLLRNLRESLQRYRKD